jgi:enoyl-CoA hydratase/carnithine racemase
VVLKKSNDESRTEQVVLETISGRKEGSVLFAEILAPPMNLLGPELVRDLVSLIQQAEANDTVQVLVFKSDPDYFIAQVDVTRISEYREAAARLAGEPSLAMLFRRLSDFVFTRHAP